MTAAVGQLELVYSTYSFNFSEFLDEDLPRQFISDSSVGVSAQGAQIYSGAPYTAKYIWTINCPVTKAEAQSIVAAYQDFDSLRAGGGLPTVAVDDLTFGSRETANAVFSTPPSVSKLGRSPTHVLITFGLTQV
jgi:hypothetical protein